MGSVFIELHHKILTYCPMYIILKLLNHISAVSFCERLKKVDSYLTL